MGHLVRDAVNFFFFPVDILIEGASEGNNQQTGDVYVLYCLISFVKISTLAAESCNWNHQE